MTTNMKVPEIALKQAALPKAPELVVLEKAMHTLTELVEAGGVDLYRLGELLRCSIGCQELYSQFQVERRASLQKGRSGTPASLKYSASILALGMILSNNPNFSMLPTFLDAADTARKADAVDHNRSNE